MKKQKGYTLVEMLIVLAIMAILSSLTVVSVGIINKAKYNAAISNFKSQLSGLSIITKATAQPQSTSSTSSTTGYVGEPLCMRLYEDTNKEVCYLVLGYQTTTGFVPKYEREGRDEAYAKQNHEMIVFPRFVGIKYTKSKDEQENTLTSTSDTSDIKSITLIEFNKSDGSVRYGAGDYEFNFKGNKVGTIVLDEYTGKNGIK
ncbi:MAG: type II secretion system protein [Eubacteriales bacterium]|nr:type II secretion system protein [Eubacteriales bacterium]